MAAVAKPINFSWIPGPGKGGQFSNSNVHEADTSYLNLVTGLLVDGFHWFSMPGQIQYGTTRADPINAIQIFNRYTGTAQTLTSNVIIATSGGDVWNQTTNAHIRTGLGTGRMVFQTVKNRLYMANGTDVPLISATGSIVTTPWGGSPQVPNLLYTTTQPTLITSPDTLGTLGGGSTGICNVNGTTVTWVSGVIFTYFRGDDLININGQFAKVVAGSVSQAVMTISVNLGVLNNVNFSYLPSTQLSTVSVQGNNTSPTITWVSGWKFNDTATYGGPNLQVGNAIYVNGEAHTIAAIPAINQITLNSNYTGDTNPAAHNVACQINFGQVSWDTTTTGYQYAASYYNLITGHVTNTCNVLFVNDGSPSNKNVNPTISNIIFTGDTTNFTKIILWRSAKAGSSLFALALLDNFFFVSPPAPLSYTDNLADDTALGLVTGGPGKLPAPAYGPNGTNKPAPADLNHIEYWDGRFWGSRNLLIGVLSYSMATTDTNNSTVGVPEECWPSDYTRIVPESDGRITGLKTVGENLYVLTDNNIYMVVGNTFSNYYLIRISAKGKGTSHYAAAVLPSEDAQAGDTLLHFGNDGRLYFLFGQGSDRPNTFPIQDQVNLNVAGIPGGTSPSQATNVGTIHTKWATYIYMAVNGHSYFYDLDRQIWFTQTNVPGNAYAEGLINGTVTQFVADVFGNLFTLFTGGASPVGFWQISTQFVNVPGTQRGDFKSLQAVLVYGDPVVDPGVTASVDGAVGSTTFTLMTTTDTRFNIYADGPDCRVYVPQGQILQGRYFSVNVFNSTPTSLEQVREIKAIWGMTQDANSAGGGNL